MAEPLLDRTEQESEFWNRPPGGADGPPPSPSRPARTPRPVVPLVISDRFSDRALEWFRDRRSDPRAGVAALVLVAVVAGFIWYRVGVGGGDAGAVPRARAVAAAASAPSAAPTTVTGIVSPADARVVVHVAGAVQTPGVVELGANARVIDAVEAVGGATPDGDLDRLNLAAKLVDGARIYVAKVGERDPGVVTGAAGSAGVGSDGAAEPSAGPAALVNLNTATQAQLEELPGIGPSYARAIIAERERRGGFTSVNELRSVRGIGDKRFGDLAPLVTV